MSYVILDKEEFSLHSQQMDYPADVNVQVHRAVEEVVNWLQDKRGAFHPGFVERWYERFLTLQNR
jgi:protein associated with RNAse G/E